jgi:hypothetical protein
MLLLADRNYAAADLVRALAATKADLLIRCKTGRRLPVIARLADGSWLSVIGTVRIRVIEARITIRTTTGTHTDSYRLITTLLDPRRYPAGELIRLYHQRWEIEVRHLWCGSSRGRFSPRFSFLRPGLDPDRASFTTALHAARDQVVQAAGVIADTVIDLVGAIGRRVLTCLLPDRRVRVKARMIKRSNSKYQARGPNIDRHSYQATISIDIITEP